MKPYLSRMGMNVPDEGLALGLGGLEKGCRRSSLPGHTGHSQIQDNTPSRFY
ncbi:hypothetical protein PO124_22360 [Bacillus licheniformis]|nr:hypothetical protein [Bacillus licheniformis]